MIAIREARFEELSQILELYLHLHETVVPEESEEMRRTWRKIVSDDDHHLIVCEPDGEGVRLCGLNICCRKRSSKCSTS